MMNPVVSMVLAVGVTASAMFSDVIVDLVTDPPSIVCEEAWVTDCERITGGVELVATNAPDMVFTFDGLSYDVPLGYEVVSVDSEAVLFRGEGTSVPLSFAPTTVKVRFFALTGDIDWSEVSTISAKAQPSVMALAVEDEEPTEEVGFKRLVNSGEFVLNVASNANYSVEFEGYTVEAGHSVTGTVGSLSAACISDGNRWNTGSMDLTITGLLELDGTYTFRAGADDTADVTIGDATSSIGGTHAFEWGNWATVTGEGLVPVTATFTTAGGPYEFNIEGDLSLDLSRFEGIPYGTLTVSPNPIVIESWSNLTSIPVSISATCSPDVTYSIQVRGAGLSRDEHGSYLFDPKVYLEAGPELAPLEVILTETFVDANPKNNAPQVHETKVFVPVQLPPIPAVNVTLDPANLTVTNGSDGGIITIKVECEEEGVTFEYASDALLAVSNATARASVDLLNLRDYYVKENQSVDERFNAGVMWTAKVGSYVLASDIEEVMVNLKITPKTRQCNACCTEGTTTEVELSCVSFSQRFGRTPLLAGMPEGALMIEEENLSDALFTPAVLRYDHPMMRQLNVATRVVTEPNGNLLTYDNKGHPCGANVAEDSRLIQQVDGTFHERFPDRSVVEYDAEGHVVALISPQGVRALVSELGITVERDEAGVLTRITSIADGVMEIMIDSPTAYRVVWTDTEGNVAKNLVFTKEGALTLCLVDNTNYPTRWTWNEELHDFVMTRGNASEATTVERSVVYSGTQATVTKRYLKNGVVASEETEVVDAVNGNAVIGRTVGGRQTMSATRVTEGNGLGKLASTTDALGAVTAYTYDTYGRVLTQKTVGETTNVITYVYAADEYDRRPWSTVETEDGEIVREETFSDVMFLNGERVETSTTCDLTTIRQYYSADSNNRFEAGKPKMLLRPDGRMTTYDYDATTLTVTQTEGVADEDVNFTLVEGKSTRTLTTYDVRGNAVRIEREAWVEGVWRPLTWETRTYSAAHKHLGSVYSNGLSTDSRWNCTGPLWEIGTDTIATTNSYNTLKQMVTSTRYGSFGALTMTYEYDAAGNVVRTQRGDLVSTSTYDLSGRLTAETDEQGRTTTYAYPNEQTTVVTSPSGATRQTVRDSQGRTLSVTGSAVTSEYYTYGPNWQKVTYRTPNGARWTKTFTDGLGRTVRIESAGANGSVIVSQKTYNDKGQLVRKETTGEAPIVYTYNAWGEVVATQRGERVPQEQTSSYVLIDGEVWLEEVSKMGDLVQRRRTDAEGFTQISTDVRGNETVTSVVFDGATQTTTTTLPGVANPQVSVTLDGVTVSETDTSGVTQTMNYDVYRRVVSQTDGRNNTTTRVYDAFGRLASVTDAAGATTSYVYDNVGNVASVTNALGNVVAYLYDIRGNKVYEGGATYPVAYEYDTFGRKVKMTTFREETENAEGDVTTWTYDEATGSLLAKTYADGRGVSYTLTNDGKTASRTDARGKVTTYTYNDYGELVSQDYSDETTDIVMTYDNLGRVTQVTDAAGVTSFTYNAYGELTNETNLKTLTRHYDELGRNVGWTLDGSRKNIIQYDNVTGRLYRMQAGGAWFTWGYLPGTNLKSSLTYGASGNTTWEYEPHRDLLTRVKNTIYGAVASQYDYTNDIGGRRTQIAKSGTMMAQNEVQDYGYNTRDELISGQGLTYNYDDIGNRITAEGKVYTANNLNQYTTIDTFEPQYDADGNQTLIKTSTGVWSVTYNAENRPVRWVRGNTVVTMDFDRMGRRVFYKEEVNGEVVTHHKFVYDNYLCVQKLDALNNNSQLNLFVWDPTESVATRPLFMLANPGNYKLFYTFDGNKNVSELVHFESRNGIAAHYDYAPFGAVTRSVSASTITDNTFTTDNPFRFSSEYHDDTLGLVYYNYRHYNPIDGRWCGRDFLTNIGEYLFCQNSNLMKCDWLGLFPQPLIGATTLSQALDALFDVSQVADEDWELKMPKYDTKVDSEEILLQCANVLCPTVSYQAIVTIKAVYKMTQPSVVVPIWRKSGASIEELTFFNQIRAIVVEHEVGHIQIWKTYIKRLPQEAVGKYESCGRRGIEEMAKINAEGNLEDAYFKVFEAFKVENNAFQLKEEKSGRHQLVKKLIEEYKTQKKGEQR